MSGTGKALDKLTSLIKCIKCSLFQNPSLKYCFASPTKETTPLHWGKLPKDGVWVSEHRTQSNWWMPPSLELRAASQSCRLAGGGQMATRPDQRPARPLILKFKGESGGREDACCLRSQLLASEVPPHTLGTGLFPASHISRKTQED